MSRGINKVILSPYERMMQRAEWVAEAGCLIYTGSVDGGGYGTVSSQHGKSPYKAHRLAYEHHFGPIPAGMVVRHKCDTPRCVAQHHLQLGTQKDNAGDMVRRGRLNPRSRLNLRPGARGYYGAGPKNAEQ